MDSKTSLEKLLIWVAKYRIEHDAFRDVYWMNGQQFTFGELMKWFYAEHKDARPIDPGYL